MYFSSTEDWFWKENIGFLNTGIQYGFESSKFDLWGLKSIPDMRVFIDQFFVEKFLSRKWLRREKMSKASLSCDWLGVIGWSLLRLGAVGVVHADLLLHYQITIFWFFCTKKTPEKSKIICENRERSELSLIY